MPRLAGLLTQLSGAGCVLVGTVAFALLIDQMDGAYLAILGSWIAAGMLALVCGGIASRPSPAALVVSAALDAGFCGVLIAVASRLTVWLRILSVDDASTASTVVVGIGVTAGVSTLLSLVATPLALRYWRANDAGASRSMRERPGSGQALPLDPANTAPGFPPPLVTGAFQVGAPGTTNDLRQMGPMDSGIMVAPAGTGMPDRKDEPRERDERGAKARVEKTSVPQQAPARQPAGPPAGPMVGFGPPQSMQPQTGMPQPSPYAPPQQQMQQPSPYAPPNAMGFAPPTSMQPQTGMPQPSPYAPPPGGPVQMGAKIEPQPPMRRNPTPAPPFPQPVHNDHTPPPYFPGSQGHFGHANALPYGHVPHGDHTPPPMMQPGMPMPMQPPMPQPGMPPMMMNPGMQPPIMQPAGMPQPGMPQPGMPPPGMPQPGMPQPGMPPMMQPPPGMGYGPGPGPGFGPPPAMGLRRDPTPPINPAMRTVGFEQPAPPRSLRGLWITTAVLAVGGVIGLIVLLASGDSSTGTTAQASTAPTKKNGKEPAAKGSGATAPISPATGSGDEPATAATGPSLATPRALLDAIHEATRRADTAAIEKLAAPSVFGFGMRATSINRNADELSTAFANDLGAPPSSGFTVTPSGVEIGEGNGHAWIAEELDVEANGERRRFAITMLAAKLGESWRLVAWHWAVRIPDEKVERLAEEGDLPIPEGFDDRIEAPAEAAEAFRSAFSSTESYALAISPRESSFNFGSAPGERLQGGDTIRRVFRKLRADIQIREGVMVTANGSWDPSKAAAPDVAWGAANVEFATKSSRRILRVLAIMVRENDEWRLVQTQWSDGG